jgi:hypothetical protein
MVSSLASERRLAQAPARQESSARSQVLGRSLPNASGKRSEVPYGQNNCAMTPQGMSKIPGSELTTTEIKQLYAGQGLSETQLQRIEVALSLNIPATYRNLLSLVGSNARSIPAWVGSDWTSDIADLVDLNLAARELLQENPHLKQLPEDAFVLLLHQGYSLLFVHATLGDASPVYTYAETDEPWMTAFECVGETLDGYMMLIDAELWAVARRITMSTEGP